MTKEARIPNDECDNYSRRCSASSSFVIWLGFGHSFVTGYFVIRQFLRGAIPFMQYSLAESVGRGLATYFRHEMHHDPDGLFALAVRTIPITSQVFAKGSPKAIS